MDEEPMSWFGSTQKQIHQSANTNLKSKEYQS
jgi:hypothetical protein